MTAAPSRPLEGVTVLDLTVALAGPYATLLLGGLGATVIKVENPQPGGDTSRNNAPYVGASGLSLARTGEDDMSVAMLERGRNKLSITLNLKHPRARELFAELVAQSDVVVENYPAGTADRLGIGYSFCSEANERIIYTALSGFGATGARRAQKGMDTIFQAMSGLMTVSGAAGEPPVRSGIPFGDMSGPLFAVIGTLAALHHRERTGLGQFVDVSLLGALTSVVATEPFDKLEQLGIPTRTGNAVPRLAPFGIFPTADGHLALCAPLDRMVRGVFAAMDRPDLEEDDRFRSRDDRVRNWVELHALIEAWSRSRSTEEAVNLLQAGGAPAAPVREPHEAVRDPELLARGETAQLVHPRFGPVDDLIGSGFPIGFSRAAAGYEGLPPYLGEHSEVILGGMLGLDDEEIAGLRADGVI
ncbi:MAG TPA: CoA transferase [Solirubrobacteraceae bacterium]|nr:CoA transferase [Solirubrobacteraceae bacterium]